MGEHVIKIKKLYKSYGKLVAVNGIDMFVLPTECFGLLGPNGAGKTTTMKMIYGKSSPDKNKDTCINVFGLDPRKDSLLVKSFSGVVPQQDNLDLELNARENLKIYSRFYGLGAKEADQRIDELLEFMELSEKSKANVRELSGGMQRRLTIARALLNQPKLLFLDEPTTGLDPQVRHLIWNKLRELKQKGLTILLTTHYMEEAFQICDKIVIMDKGNRILTGEPRQLLEGNLEKYVLEIYDLCQDDSSCEGYFKNHHIRYEYFQELFCAYSNDMNQLRGYAETIPPSSYRLRASNLEDLFLKVTGRHLNELQ
jgi:lipooligosaccharide transport system ATP-binding protein